jgi:hypothetical protein
MTAIEKWALRLAKSGTAAHHPKRSFVPCWRTRFRLPARRLRLRFLPKIWVRLCKCARFTQRQPAASPERAGGLQAVPWLRVVGAKSGQAGHGNEQRVAIRFIGSLHLIKRVPDR